MKIKNFISCLLIVSLFSCNDDDVDFSNQDEIVNVVDLIAEGSPLFNKMETVSDELPFTDTVCLKFVYSFTLIEYDPEGVEVTRTVVTSDATFNTALKSVAEDNYINLSFPISATLEDGTVLEIETKEALQENLEQCIDQLQEDIAGYCNGVIQESVWVVKLPEGTVNDPYLNSVFTETTNGLNTYFYRGDPYSSSWLFYFIEDKLHLNMVLENEELGQNWNFDWEVEIANFQSFIEIGILNLENQEYILKREDNPDNYCTTLEFKECELTDGSNMAEFNLENYIECIDIIGAPLDEDGLSQNTIDFEFTFFTTEENANTAQEQIDTAEPYINTENPETIYVRIEDPTTNEFIVRAILLVVESCD